VDGEPRLTVEDKAAAFDAWERANKRFGGRVRDVAGMPASEWRSGWLAAYNEYWDVVLEEMR
jgi:hypothetical protein